MHDNVRIPPRQLFLGFPGVMCKANVYIHTRLLSLLLHVRRSLAATLYKTFGYKGSPSCTSLGFRTIHLCTLTLSQAPLSAAAAHSNHSNQMPQYMYWRLRQGPMVGGHEWPMGALDGRYMRKIHNNLCPITPSFIWGSPAHV